MIANEWRSVAIAWHVLLAVLLASLCAGWRPSARLLLPMLVMPVIGVSALAALVGNAFNTGAFAALALTLGAFAMTHADTRMEVAPTRWASIGAALVVFGAVYPHFVDVEAWLEYAYVAPLGIVPCPTLAVLIGLTLILRGIDTPKWSWILVAAGVFYATVGLVWLRVAIDVVLLAGAGALTMQTIDARRSRTPWPTLLRRPGRRPRARSLREFSRDRAKTRT